MIESRISIVKKQKINDKQKNCFSTALYIKGLIKNDTFIDSSEASNFLKNRTKIPKYGSLVVFRHPQWNNKLHHMGIITKVESLKITHRFGRQGFLKENELLESVINYYNEREKLQFKDSNFKGFNVEYYN